MLTTACVDRCAHCSGKVIDLQDEMVCSACGMVTPKMVIEPAEGKKPQALDFTSHALGSYLGPIDCGYEERHSKGFSRTSSTFRYLKTISDFSYSDGPGVYSCAKLMQRICEKLLLPPTVIAESVRIAKEVIAIRRPGSGFTVAAISAFSVMTACKICGVASVGVREVLGAHRDLGHRVKSTSLIRMSIESPIRPRARRAEEYLARVAAHLSDVPPLQGDGVARYQARLLEIARVVLDALGPTVRGGHNPCAMAATSVYAAEVILARMEGRPKRLTQSRLAMCADVAEYTVREQYGEIFRPKMEEIHRLVGLESRLRGPTTRSFPSPLVQTIR